MKLFRLALIIGLGAAPLSAQEEVEEEVEADRIADCFDYCGPLVVEGQPARGLPTALGTYRSQEVSSDSGIENSLRNMPGLQQFRRSDSRSANPTSQGVTMRGLGGNASSRAVVTLDGVPQMDPFGGWISWTGIDSTATAKAIVSSGGGFVRAGPGAVAGLIELHSARADIGSTGDRFGFGLQGGSFGTASARADGLVDIGGAIVQFSGAAERSDGFRPIIAAQRGPVDGRAEYRNRGGAIRLLRAVADNIEVQANLRSWSDRRSRGTDFSDSSNGGTDASVRVVAVGSVDWTLLGYYQDRDFSSEFGSINAARSTVTPVLDQYAVPAKGWGASGSVGFELANNFGLKLGADWRRTEGETREDFFFTGPIAGRNRIAGGQTEAIGGFAELGINEIYKLDIALSGRVDRWQIGNGFRREINIGGTVRSNDRFADRRGTEPTARAAFDWTFHESGIVENAHLRGSLFTGWRLPTLNELYRPFRVGNDATAANEALRPERVRGAELGLSWRNGDIGLSLTGFANRLKGAIANVTLGQGPGNFPGVGFVAAGGAYRQRQNLDAIVSRGFELEADGWIDSNLRFEVGYAFIDAKVRASGAAALLNGLRPAQVARHHGRLSLLFDALTTAKESSHAFIGSGVTLRYFGNQFEDDANRQRLNDALTLDARLHYQLKPGVSFRLIAENLFDARVEAAISSTGIIERTQPRSIMLGLKFDVP